MSAREYAKVHGVLRPKLDKFAFFIDGGGSSRENLVGHTIVLLDEYSITELESEIRGILDRHGLPELHGRMLATENLGVYDKAYDELFRSFAKCCSKANLKYCTSRLGPNSEQNRNYQDLRAFILSFFDKINVSRESKRLITDPITYLTLPIMELVDKTTISQSADIKVDVWVDRTSNYDKISTRQIALPGSFAISIGPFHEVAPLIVNALLHSVMKTPLQLSSIQFTTPERSCILQLVDAIANFSLNFVRMQIDPQSSLSPVRAFKKMKFEQLMRLFEMDKTEIAAVGTQIAANWTLVGSKITPLSNDPISLFAFK